MFDAFKAANGYTHDDNEHIHAMHHEEANGHEEDGYEHEHYEQFHDGHGGQDHDNDGHHHEQYGVRYHAGPREHDHMQENNPSAIKQLHDGPGGHHHDDDGHHHKNHNEAATEAEENKGSNEDVRKFTLIISKLLFQMSQM